MPTPSETIAQANNVFDQLMSTEYRGAGVWIIDQYSLYNLQKGVTHYEFSYQGPVPTFRGMEYKVCRHLFPEDRDTGVGGPEYDPTRDAIDLENQPQEIAIRYTKMSGRTGYLDAPGNDPRVK